jgi:hypothetical protein
MPPSPASQQRTPRGHACCAARRRPRVVSALRRGKRACRHFRNACDVPLRFIFSVGALMAVGLTVMAAAAAICHIVYTIAFPALQVSPPDSSPLSDEYRRGITVCTLVAIILVVEFAVLCVTLTTTLIAEMSFLAWARGRMMRKIRSTRRHLLLQLSSSSSSMSSSTFTSSRTTTTVTDGPQTELDGAISVVSTYSRAVDAASVAVLVCLFSFAIYSVLAAFAYLSSTSSDLDKDGHPDDPPKDWAPWIEDLLRVSGVNFLVTCNLGLFAILVVGASLRGLVALSIVVWGMLRTPGVRWQSRAARYGTVFLIILASPLLLLLLAPTHTLLDLLSRTLPLDSSAGTRVLSMRRALSDFYSNLIVVDWTDFAPDTVADLPVLPDEGRQPPGIGKGEDSEVLKGAGLLAEELEPQVTKSHAAFLYALGAGDSSWANFRASMSSFSPWYILLWGAAGIYGFNAGKTSADLSLAPEVGVQLLALFVLVALHSLHPVVMGSVWGAKKIREKLAGRSKRKRSAGMAVEQGTVGGTAGTPTPSSVAAPPSSPAPDAPTLSAEVVVEVVDDAEVVDGPSWPGVEGDTSARGDNAAAPVPTGENVGEAEVLQKGEGDEGAGNGSGDDGTTIKDLPPADTGSSVSQRIVSTERASAAPSASAEGQADDVASSSSSESNSAPVPSPGTTSTSTSTTCMGLVSLRARREGSLGPSLAGDVNGACGLGAALFSICIFASLEALALRPALGVLMVAACLILSGSWCLRKPKATATANTCRFLLAAITSIYGVLSDTAIETIPSGAEPLWQIAPTWNNRPVADARIAKVDLPYDVCEADFNGATALDQCFMSYAVYQPRAFSTFPVTSWFAAAGRTLVPVSNCSALDYDGHGESGLRFDAFVELEGVDPSEADAVAAACTRGAPGSDAPFLGTSRRLYFIFRGTKSARDIASDVLTWQEAAFFKLLSAIGPYSSWPVEIRRGFVASLASVLSWISSSDLDQVYYTDEAPVIVSRYRAKFPNATLSIAGHSLGGGLSSIVGQALRVPSLSFSGPGYEIVAGKIPALADMPPPFKLVYGDTTVVIPDNDPVPRVDAHVGTRQNIDCLASTSSAKCHSIGRTCCELRRVCGDKHGRTLAYCTNRTPYE